jgi:putative ABC transport system ATP-binding protein
MIELHTIKKTYGEGAARVDALRGIDLSVQRGEFVSIMGPSGSGKSTLLNLISALDTPSSGTIRIDGNDISRLDDDALTLFRRRRIGLVFQFFNLLPTLNALDNVLLPVLLDRRVRPADRARAESLLATVGLASRLRHHMSQLSGGEMQRVAIARALMLEPPLLLADEPTGNLDSATGAAVLDVLKQTSVATGTTVMMVTHDRNAAAVGDRVVWMKDGLVWHDESTQQAAE